jgi:hypothetical protein
VSGAASARAASNVTIANTRNDVEPIAPRRHLVDAPSALAATQNLP